MKRFLFGVVWFLAFWFVANVGLGLYAGVRVGMQHPHHAGSANVAQGEAAGRALSRRYGAYVLLGALVLSVAGTWAGVLPGTKRRRDDAAKVEKATE